MVISAGQVVRQVSIGTDSIVPIQNNTFPQKNVPNLRKSFQITLSILGFLLRVSCRWFCRRFLNGYIPGRNLRHLFGRRRLTGWFPKQRQFCWSSLLLTFLLVFTYEKDNKNPYHFMKNKKHDLFTKESLSVIGDIRSDYTHEQLSVWALSDLKFRNNKSFIKFLLLLSGDIHLHPGPPKICQTRNKSVRKGLPCTQCGVWVHKRCDQISDVEFATLPR